MAERDIANKQPSYATDIAHLLPAELTAFYIGAKGIIPPISTGNNGALNSYLFLILIGFAIVITLVFFFIMPSMLRVAGLSQRVLYCVTFLVWFAGIEIDRLASLLPSNSSEKIIVPVILNLAGPSGVLEYLSFLGK